MAEHSEAGSHEILTKSLLGVKGLPDRLDVETACIKTRKAINKNGSIDAKKITSTKLQLEKGLETFGRKLLSKEN